MVHHPVKAKATPREKQVRNDFFSQLAGLPWHLETSRRKLYLVQFEATGTNHEELGMPSHAASMDPARLYQRP